MVWRKDPADGYDIRTDPPYVRQACEASLRRLGVDHLDLYYVHHRSETVPIEDTVLALTELIDQGKIGAIGLSNVTAEDLRRAHAVHPVLALQEQWSLVSRSVEAELVPAAAELGVTVVAHSPTGHGLLHDLDGDDEHPQLRAVLDELASAYGATRGQIALAWVHHRSQPHRVPVVPLPGTTRVSHLHRNVEAAELALSPDALRRLDRASVD